ncbi:MAG TPA: tetratricopeptide repeat protein [Ktedonobacterales bacterium]|nr:tetratricopeptide repeat protein [Ktedonobacterales bacterium]
MLETLAHLVEKSLVEPEAPNGRAEGRFRLLETIRQYARDRLQEAGEAALIRDRHLTCYLRFAEEAEPRLRGHEQLVWLERVETEHDNLRAALAWALEGGTSGPALALAGALSYFWTLRSYFSEGLRWLEGALALAEREQSERGTAGPHTPTQAEKARRAKALYGSAMPYLATLRMERARAAVEESLRLWRELGDTWWMAVTAESLALVLSSTGNFQAARACLEEGVALARTIEDPLPLAVCLVRMGDVWRPLGDLNAARVLLEEGVALARSVGDRSVLSEGLRELGTAYYAAGDLTAAVSAIEEALTHARAIGSLIQVLLALMHLVTISCLQNDVAKAKRYRSEGWAIFRETGAPFAFLFSVVTFGLVDGSSGVPERGVRLLSAAENTLRQQGMDLSREDMDPLTLFYKHVLVQARAQLGPAKYEVARHAGEAMTMEQMLSLVSDIARTEAEQESDAG